MSRHTRPRVSTYLAIAIVMASMSATIVVLIRLHSSIPAKTTSIITPSAQATKTPQQPSQQVYSLPTRLVIAKIGVDTNIIPMGITTSGDMESPATNKAAGWYKYGARPGNVGSAVIDGHLGLSSEAVFGKLDQLTVGDIISVIDDQGSTISFTVTKVATYERDSDATEIFNSKEGTHLNLITCNGDWESHQATYSKRLVVFSDKVATANK